MRSVSFSVPGPVKGKGRPRSRVVTPRNGKPFASVYTDAQTRNYEAEVRFYATRAMEGQLLFDGPVCVTFIAKFLPPKSASKTKTADMLAGDIMPTKKPDADNIIKIADALNGVVFKDDAQIVEAFIRKKYSIEPGLEIIVSEYRNQEFDLEAA